LRDSRRVDDKELRSSRTLPLPRNKDEGQDFYYEFQLSVLVTGVDEWLWTSYCCVDTYYGSEPDRRAYLEDVHPVEPASGGGASLDFPLWNPREYYLVVLSRRVSQATREWGALIETFEERMITYVG
jgi:hypothetical protein